MFENVGEKIKSVAKWWFILQCVAYCSLGIGLVANGGDVMFVVMLLIWIFGPLVAWLLSLILYGFGEIVDTAIINRKEQSATVQKSAPAQPAPRAKSNATSNKVQKPQKVEFLFDNGADPFTEDAEFVDVRCPRCKEPLSFLKGEKEGLCPNCGNLFDL